MSKEVKDAPEVKTSVAKLRAAIVTTLIGSVVGMSQRKAGGKFKHDTRIVTLSNVVTGETIDVFITEAQWREYSCGNYLFMNNIVSMSLEECIEGETGYMENSDAVEMTAHEATFNAFHRVINVDTVILMTTLSKEKVDPAIIGMIVGNLSSIRNAFERSNNAAAAGGNGGLF